MHGSYAANKTADECDLMFSIGCRFNDRVTGEIKKFAPNAKIVHIDIESAAISRNVTVDIPIVADAKAAILKILEHTEPMEHKEWLDEIQGWDKEYPLQMEVKDGQNYCRAGLHADLRTGEPERRGPCAGDVASDGQSLSGADGTLGGYPPDPPFDAQINLNRGRGEGAAKNPQPDATVG